MRINSGWHLRAGYRHTDPTCSSQNIMCQVRDPGASSHSLLVSAHVSANVLYQENKLTVMTVKSSYLPLQSPPLPKSHIWYPVKQHLTHPLVEPWHLSSIMLAPLKARMLCSCPRLWLTRWLWAMIAARALRESKWTDSGSVKTLPNALTTLLY